MTDSKPEIISIPECARLQGVSAQAVYKKLNTTYKDYKTVDERGKLALFRTVLDIGKEPKAPEPTTEDDNTVKTLLRMMEEKDRQITQLQSKLTEQNDKLLKLIEQQQQLTLLAEQRRPFFKRLLKK